MTTEIETMTGDLTDACDHCEYEMTAAQYDAGNGLCDACHGLHFECGECSERTLKTDVHATRPGLCQSCGDEAIEAEHQDALDAAKDDLQGLFDTLVDGEDLDKIRKAIEALKAIA